MFKICLNRHVYIIVTKYKKGSYLFKLYTTEHKFISSFPVDSLDTGVKLAYRLQGPMGKAC